MSAQYSAFLGKRVEVLYRSSDIYLPATGTLVADSGRSVFLEAHFNQNGRPSTFRWEIPYGCITRLNEAQPPSPPPDEGRLILEMEAQDFDAAPLLQWRQRPTQS